MTPTQRKAMEQALDGLIESARLLGATQAKKGFGCYTQEDARLERSWHESIAKHSVALRAALAEKPVVPTVCIACGSHDGHHQNCARVRWGVETTTEAPHSAIPPGYKLVPVEPTDEMLDAALKYCSSGSGIQGGDVTDAIRDAINASPEAPRPADRAPFSPRELELIDGMIEIHQIHAERCVTIANQRIAARQREWDLERVKLLSKIRAAGI